MAVAIGFAQGFYKAKLELDIERLKTIGELTNIPIVLHGGSGIPKYAYRARPTTGRVFCGGKAIMNDNLYTRRG